MSSGIDYGFPAGDESDGSNDEWDIGHSSAKNLTAIQNEEIVAVDDLSMCKTAISKGDIGAVEQLLDKGLDVDSRLSFGWTLLMCAVHGANYDIAKLLLDRGASANFSKDHWTVLMAACTANAIEDRIVSCVDLLLSRHADPNLVGRTSMSCLMLAARDGYSKLINLLVSHNAGLNAQDFSGYTALATAVQYGREEAVLKLLQLGADKTIRNKLGKSPADLAVIFKQPQIARILAASPRTYSSFSKEENPTEIQPDPVVSEERQAKLNDIELFLHGLNLGCLGDVVRENDITWSDLMSMEKAELEKIGIRAHNEQQKVLNAMKAMQLDRVDLGTLHQLDHIDVGSEELYNFLISLSQQCCYLTETIQDTIRRFPQRASQLVLSLDPQQKAQEMCNQLVIQTGDLQREVTCLRNLLDQVEQAGGSCHLTLTNANGTWRRWLLPGIALCTLGAGLVFLFSKATGSKVHMLIHRKFH